MQRSTPIALLLGATLAILSYPATASAVPIHQHYQVAHHHQRIIPRPNGSHRLAVWTTQETRTRIVDVAPADSDQDGIADSSDDCPSTPYSGNGGCPPPLPPAPSSTYVSSTPTPTSSYATSSGDWANVPGVPASFAACVAMAESTNGTNPAAGGNVYGIIDPVPGTDPVADPQGAMAALYAQAGPAAWSPYDGC